MSNYTENVFSDDPNHVWNKLIHLIPKKSLVLDVGCSSGNLGEILIEKKDCIVDGIEIDKADAKIAAKKLRHVEIFDINEPKNFDRYTDRYDIIIFADVLEHLVDPAKVLERVKSLLKPKGAIVFSIPNMAHVSVRLDLLAGNFRHTETGVIDKTHLHFYTQEEAIRIFTAAGLHMNHFDVSPYPYPESLIKRKFEEMGLTPSEKTMEMLRRPDAAAFQFVGAATNEPGSKQNKTLPPVMPIENDMHLMAATLAAKEAELKKAQEANNEQALTIQRLTDQIKDLNNSRALKISRAITGTFRKSTKEKTN